MITWRPVTSSNVAAVGWPNQTRPDEEPTQYPLTLIMFKDGRVYGYPGSSRQRAVYIATRCDSVGRYVNMVMKKEFSAVRIPELDQTGPPF